MWLLLHLLFNHASVVVLLLVLVVIAVVMMVVVIVVVMMVVVVVMMVVVVRVVVVGKAAGRPLVRGVGSPLGNRPNLRYDILLFLTFPPSC